MYNSVMPTRLTPYHAQMVAQNVDYNYNGLIETRELKFRRGSRRLADLNQDSIVTTQELAHSLMRGDIYISPDRKAYPLYQSPYPVAPGYPYQQPTPYPNYGGVGMTLGMSAVGAGVGAGVGYAVSGAAGVGTGAIVGGLVGFFGSLFTR